MEVKEKTSKRNYGKMGCFAAIILLILIIILVWAGLINFPE